MRVKNCGYFGLLLSRICQSLPCYFVPVFSWKSWRCYEAHLEFLLFGQSTFHMQLLLFHGVLEGWGSSGKGSLCCFPPGCPYGAVLGEEHNHCPTRTLCKGQALIARGQGVFWDAGSVPPVHMLSSQDTSLVPPRTGSSAEVSQYKAESS